MAKKGKSKSKKSKKGPIKLSNREKTSLIGLFVLIILIVLILTVSCTREKKQGVVYESKKDEPEFVPEGRLYFIEGESGDTIKDIVIEIADNDKDRSQGMMYRSSMPDSTGMLFVFEQPKEQSFWMKNTSISLDILYVDENGEIVTLHKYTTPYSENKIPSYGEAKYVVEVLGGFTNRYQIDKGDKISYIQQQ